MEILVLSQYWYPEEGAPQRRWQWLSLILAEQGHHVTAIAPPPVYKRRLSKRQWFYQQARSVLKPEEERGPSGETIIRSPFIQAGSSIRVRAMNQFVVAVGTAVTAVRRAITTQTKPKIVIGTVPALPTLFAAYAVARVFRAAFVVDLRDAWPELLTHMDDWGRETTRADFISKLRLVRTLRVLSARIFIAVYARADAIIVTTQSHSRSLTQTLGGKTPPVCVIRNVFPPSVESEPVVSRCRTPRDRTLNVLYAGTVGRAQQISSAVEAVAIARDQYSVRVNFRVIGDGAGWETARQRAKELEVPLDLRHHISPTELAPHYQWADTALVHLAAWEALQTTVPSKVYELMELHKHVTLVANGEASWLVSQLDAGACVEPGDPAKLAQVWSRLAADVPLEVSDAGHKWVLKERDKVAPKRLENLIGEFD